MLKTFHSEPREGRWPTWIRIRRRPSPRPGEFVAQPRVWSLLLPPRYPNDRR